MVLAAFFFRNHFRRRRLCRTRPTMKRYELVEEFEETWDDENFADATRRGTQAPPADGKLPRMRARGPETLCPCVLGPTEARYDGDGLTREPRPT